MSKYNITDLRVISNPTAEFIAFCEVLERIKELNVKFIFKIDYIGVDAWLSGKWKAKQPHIIKIKQIAKNLPVLFGGYAFDVDKKSVIWELVSDLEPQIMWLFDKNSKLKKENFDMTDAYTCGRAYMQKIEKWKP
jgi:hypothetical protein